MLIVESNSQALALVISVVMISSLIVTVPRSQAEPVTVAVTITRVVEIICADSPPPNPFQACPSDYFASVRFNDGPFQPSPTIDGSGCGIFCGFIGPFEIRPFWTFTTTVDSSIGVLPISILLEEDDDLDADELVDINPTSGSAELLLFFDLNTGTWSGDTNLGFSSGPVVAYDGDGSATIFFDIGVGSTDLDGDGLLNSWEISGYHSDTDGVVDVDLPAFGANPMHKDIFLELDWVPGQEPIQSAIQNMQSAFAAAPINAGGTLNPDGQPGINLWVDTGSLADPYGTEDGRASCSDNLDNNLNNMIDLADINCFLPTGTEGSFGSCRNNLDDDNDGRVDMLDSSCFFGHGVEDAVTSCNDGIDNGGADRLVDLADPDCYVGNNLGGGNPLPPSDIDELNSAFYEAKRDNFNRDDRGLIFRYAISGDGTGLSSGGQGEIGGNDFIDFNHDGGSIMHELGHNLNLRHGGFENKNCKPNYVSIMNYDNQYRILRSTLPDIIDYSPPRFAGGRGAAPLPTLIENNLNEATILDPTDNQNQFIFVSSTGQKMATRLNSTVDWNGDLDTSDSGLTVNIETSSTPGNNPSACQNGSTGSTLVGSDDWSNIAISFRQFGDSADGAINPVTEPEPTLQELLELQEELNTADLQIAIDDDQDPVAAGDQLAYTITITNNGPGRASAVSVTDTLPNGVSYVDGTSGCTEGPPNTITCLPGGLLAGESATISITVLVDPDLVYQAGGPVTITNNVSVESLTGPDPDPANNSASEETGIIAVADVEITSFTSSSTPHEVLIGDSFQLTLTKSIVNNGPSTPVDADVDVVATASSGVTVDPSDASTPATALEEDVPAEVMETFMITCAEPGPQQIGFVDTISPVGATDPDTADNIAAITVEVECLIPVQINIHPGSSINPINLKSKTGQVSVAILTTAEGEYGLPIPIDATKIDPLSVHFGPSDLLLNADPVGGATEFHSTGHVLDALELDEATNDGDQDLLLHFNAKQTGLSVRDTEACVKGEIDVGGTTYTFYGCDTIIVRP